MDVNIKVSIIAKSSSDKTIELGNSEAAMITKDELPSTLTPQDIIDKVIDVVHDKAKMGDGDTVKIQDKNGHDVVDGDMLLKLAMEARKEGEDTVNIQAFVITDEYAIVKNPPEEEEEEEEENHAQGGSARNNIGESQEKVKADSNKRAFEQSDGAHAIALVGASAPPPDEPKPKMKLVDTNSFETSATAASASEKPLYSEDARSWVEFATEELGLKPAEKDLETAFGLAYDAASGIKDAALNPREVIPALFMDSKGAAVAVIKESIAKGESADRAKDLARALRSLAVMVETYPPLLSIVPEVLGRIAPSQVPPPPPPPPEHLRQDNSTNNSYQLSGDADDGEDDEQYVDAQGGAQDTFNAIGTMNQIRGQPSTQMQDNRYSDVESDEGDDQGTQFYGGGGGGDTAMNFVPLQQQQQQEHNFATQMTTLVDAGFTDIARNLAALRRVNGDINNAMEILLDE